MAFFRVPRSGLRTFSTSGPSKQTETDVTWVYGRPDSVTSVADLMGGVAISLWANFFSSFVTFCFCTGRLIPLVLWLSLMIRFWCGLTLSLFFVLFVGMCSGLGVEGTPFAAACGCIEIKVNHIIH